MWIFNLKAVICVACGLGVAFFGAMSFSESRLLALFVAILTAMGVDVWMRFRSEDCDRPLIHPDAGGHVWFAPVWIVGIILSILIGLATFNII